MKKKMVHCQKSKLELKILIGSSNTYFLYVIVKKFVVFNFLALSCHYADNVRSKWEKTFPTLETAL